MYEVSGSAPRIYRWGNLLSETLESYCPPVENKGEEPSSHLGNLLVVLCQWWEEPEVKVGRAMHANLCLYGVSFFRHSIHYLGNQEPLWMFNTFQPGRNTQGGCEAGFGEGCGLGRAPRARQKCRVGGVLDYLSKMNQCSDSVY